MHNEKPTASIFINYRRDPAKPEALLIQAELERYFGPGKREIKKRPQN